LIKKVTPMRLPRVLVVGWCSVLVIITIISSGRGGRVEGQSLPVIKVGALLGVNSSIGQVALASIQLAVQDVNSNASVLPGYELSLITADTACDAFQGASSGISLLSSLLNVLE
jgi:hypothetical protein